MVGATELRLALLVQHAQHGLVRRARQAIEQPVRLRRNQHRRGLGKRPDAEVSPLAVLVECAGLGAVGLCFGGRGRIESGVLGAACLWTGVVARMPLDVLRPIG